MKRIAYVGWVWVVFSLVACGAPTPLASPVPSSTAMPTVPPTLTFVPVRVPSPSPTATRKPVLTPIFPIVPSATPRPRQFDDVDSRALLSSLFPDLKFAPFDDAFTVNGNTDRQMWIASRAEGQFIQGMTPELAAIVAHDAPRLTPDQARESAPLGSFLAIFTKRDGKPETIQRFFLFPTEISPQAFQVKIDRATDFDHDGQNDLLIITRTERFGVEITAAFLYQWDAQTFAEIWSAEIGNANTGAINQSRYFTSESTIRFADVDGDGMDEIIVDLTQVEYPKDAQGLADVDRELGRRNERRVYRWNGTIFVLDTARTTPMP